MIDERFWSEYEKNMANPISRFLNRSKIKEMEQEIDNSLPDYISSYHPEAFSIDDRNKYDRNMSTIRQVEDILEKQFSIIDNSFLPPKSKSESLVKNISDLKTDQLNFKSIEEDIIKLGEKSFDTEKLLTDTNEFLNSVGLHLNTTFREANEIRTSGITINYERNRQDVCEMNFKSVPTVEELVSYAQNNNMLTVTPPEVQDKVVQKLSKLDFSLDEVPHSYSNSGFLYHEYENKPSVFICDANDQTYERLIYNSESNSWHVSSYEFNIPNTVEELSNIYGENSLSVDEKISLSKSNQLNHSSFTEKIHDNVVNDEVNLMKNKKNVYKNKLSMELEH